MVLGTGKATTQPHAESTQYLAILAQVAGPWQWPPKRGAMMRLLLSQIPRDAHSVLLIPEG